ncbi:MAG: DNA polymerase I [Phycisphaerales bacterium]|nr:MAG: DNA polymerase I [Phycisphaerales bacterium]
MAKTFYILDGHYQIYRAFYGLPQSLTSPTGEPTGATHVFCTMLFGLIRERKPDYLAVAMDVSDETVFRCEIDPHYKANREPAPEALHLQADRIVAIVQALGIPIYRKEGFEADDLMATIAERLKHEDVHIYLVSRDKDLEQLLSERVRLFDSKKGQVTDPATLLEEKGYTPQQGVEVQTLSGDSTDNIPGVPGIGTKTAAKLIAKYGSAEAVVERANELTPKMGENVKAFAQQLPITRELVTLRRDVPFDFDLSDCSVDRIDTASVLPIFEELGFSKLKDSLAGITGGDSLSPADAPPSTPIAAESDRYELIDTPTKLEEFIGKLTKQDSFAFDTETTGLNPVRADLVGLSFCWQAGEAYYIPVRAVTGSTLPIGLVVEKLGPIFADPSITKVGQNAKYDILVLRQVGIPVKGVAFDTMLASFLLDPTRSSHSLDALTKTLLGHEMIPITDLISKGKNQITMDQVDTKQVSEYAAEDADFTWRLKEVFEPRMAGSHVEQLFHDTEMPLVDVLAEMEHNGIALDEKLLAKLGKTMGRRLEELTTEVHQAAGHAFNIDSTKQLAGVLFDEQGLEVVRKTKTGRSTDADTLSTLVAKTDHLIPKLVLEYRELAKLKNTYIDTLPKMVCPRTGRVHASFNQTGAITGRLSSSDPNLQNIPIRTEAGRQIRAAVIAGDPDNVLLTADYSQVELRLLAHFCQDEALLEAFRSGQDIHRAVAAQVNGVALDEVTSTQRSAAKAVNFGIIYGQSPFGLARSLDIPVGQARAFIDTYFMRYPGIRLFIDKCVDDAKRTGYAQTILGRRRPVPELTSRNRQQVGLGERIAVNTVVQGSAADLIKRAMINIHRELTGGKHTAKMLIQVHDELVFEVPRNDVEREAEMIRDKMEHALEFDVPIVVDMNWANTWAEGKQ